MNRLKLLAAAMLLAAPIACGDEVPPPPPTGSIDGLVSIEGQGIDAVSVTLSNGASATTANGGMFRFDGVEAGAYTVTIGNYPADASFDQTSAAATISTDGETVTVNFPGTFIRTSSIMGTVTVENEGLVGVTVKLSGTGESETLTDGNGQYAFAGLRAGNYTIEISGFDDEDVSFGSSSSAATLAVGESKVVIFEGTYLRTSGILGQITADNQPQEAVTVSLQGRGENRSMTTNSAGQYSFDGLRSGDYAIGISGYNTDEVSFDVTSKTVTVAYGETATLPFEGTLLRTAGIMGTVTVEGVGPIEDVTVTIQGNGETKSMPTNSAGMYSFNRLHAGDYSVTISGFDDDEYGFDVTTATVTVALQDTETVAFGGIMLRTAGISGEVTVGDDDAPLSGVTVTVSGGPKDEEHSATTHSDGTYLVENLHAGDYSVVISGYDTREYGFDPTTETVSVGLRETLEVAFQGELLRTAGVSGRVSVGGMGIPGVTVTLTGEEDRDPENTNADGQFGFSGLAAGDYTLTISEYDAVEYAFEPTREFELELDESEIENFTGRALRTATVMGYVTVEDAPLPGIGVTLIMGVGTSGEIVGAMPTGETGGYTFGPLLAGDYQVRIGEYADEYDFAAGDMQVTAVMTDSTATVNFAATIIRTASVSGRVTIDGDPMKDVTVTLTGDHAPDDNSRMTGDYGMYEFDDLRKGDYTLTISGYDAVDYHFEPTGESFALELGGSEIKNFTGKALRTATVMGYVTVEDAPLPGIGVTLIKVVSATSGEIVGAMATGADGGYAFGPLLAGAYQVRIGEYDDEYDFEAGDMQVTAVMTDSTATVNFAATIIRTAMVSGMVTIDGDPMKDVTVTIDGDHAPASPDNSMMTGDDGEYSFGELRKGAYTVTMTNPDDNAYSFPTVATPVNLGVGQEQPGISFAGTRLKRASISGQVHAAGDPVANVTVMLSGHADGEDVTDANGEYNFPGLAVGSYMVTISGWAEAAYIFDAPASDAVIVNNDDFLIVDFEGTHTKTASISGMLFLDEVTRDLMHTDGEPVLDLTNEIAALQAAGLLPEIVTGLPLTLLGPNLGESTLIFANADGTYEFPGLQAGSYAISVSFDEELDEAGTTVEGLLARAGYEYTGLSLIDVAVEAGEPNTDNNLPFEITKQTINVSAVMGTPDAPTETIVPGVVLALYPTAEDADKGENALGTKTTGENGVATFDFLREDDDGPGGEDNDHLVFAKVTDTGDDDLAFSDNEDIEIQYAATDRVSNALAAARLVNIKVNFQWEVMSNADAEDGNEPLGGWVADDEMGETDASGLATYSGWITSVEAIAGASYDVMLAEEQDDSVTGKEKWGQSDALKHDHNHLALPADNTSAMNHYGPIYVTWTTQSLTLGVYREADDVEGFTDYQSELAGGDHRPHSEVGRAMTVELLARESGTNRLRRHKWDVDEETGEYGKEGYASFDANGMVTFTGIDADVELTVRYRAGADREQMDYGYDEIETFGGDLDHGVTLGAFGAMGGAGPEVRMCSASDDTNADATSDEWSDEWCATFAYQWNTGTVYGTVGSERGHKVTVEPETGHGAIGDEDKTDSRGAYSIGDLQDGVYTATAASGDDDYQLLTPAEVESFALYHNEACWAATNPDPARGDERPDSCADDEVDVGDDDGTTTWAYVNGYEHDWETGRLGHSIKGYVANDGQDGEDRDNLLRGDESKADITMTLRKGTDVVGTAETNARGLYSFDDLAEGDNYTVSAGSGTNYRAIHAIEEDDGVWDFVTSKTAKAEDYTLSPDEADLDKPYWERRYSAGGAMGQPTTTVGTGTNSDKYYNFALVYTDGEVSGSVNNISGSSADIDLVFSSPVPFEDDKELTTTNSRGDFETGGLMEAIGYSVVIEDRGFAAPCMDGNDPDDDAPLSDHDGIADTPEQCTKAETTLMADIEGENDHESLGTLHVYSTMASAADELTALEVMGVTEIGGTAGEMAVYTVAVQDDEDGTNDGDVVIEVSVTYGAASVLVAATASPGAGARVMKGTSPCPGGRCTLDYHATGGSTNVDTEAARTTTITVMVTAENSYNDHAYTFDVTRTNPHGYGITAEDVFVDDDASSGTFGTTTDEKLEVQTETGATTADIRFNLEELGADSDTFCAQDVEVRRHNDDVLITPNSQTDGDTCANNQYTLSAAVDGTVYRVTIFSEDGEDEDYYLNLSRG